MVDARWRGSPRPFHFQSEERKYLMSTDTYVIPPPPQAALAIAGSDQLFPVRRVWCVGRNYLEHIKEMGQDAR